MTATQHRSAVPNRLSATVTPLRIAVVADDEITTRGVASILRTHRDQFSLVTMDSRGSVPIDIALYDPAMGGPSRLEGLAELLSDPRVRKVAIFTALFEPSRAFVFIKQGACAYMSKSMTGGEIVDALTIISAGQVVSPGVADPGVRRRLSGLHGEVLTSREAEVLSYIASGISNIAIAKTLHLSPNSVKSYIRTCYRKIGVDSRSKAVLWALSHGLGDANVDSLTQDLARSN